MSATGPRLSREEFDRLSADVYPRLVLPQLRPEDHGKFVVFDVESGAFELDDDALAAADRLHARIPGVQARLERVGFPTAFNLRSPRIGRGEVQRPPTAEPAAC